MAAIVLAFPSLYFDIYREHFITEITSLILRLKFLLSEQNRKRRYRADGLHLKAEGKS
jgi:hypothetical protein